MKEKMLNIEKLIHIKESVARMEPLIHCITNHITINDCANMVLAVGGKPIMAEHCMEVADITSSAKALAVNLGNITDDRMAAMMISGEIAYEKKIPTIIDSVGVGCSELRHSFAKDFIERCKPSIIKGNMSEIKALSGLETQVKGIDANDEDKITEETVDKQIAIVEALATKTHAVIVATGVMDIISNGRESYVIANGCKELSKITGTGCMLNVLIATFISSQDIIQGAILGTCMMGISGEVARNHRLGSFRVNLFDAISTLEADDIREKIKVKVVR